MWKLEIVKSNKNEVIGSDDRRAQHIVDVSGLPTRPRIGDVIEGHKAGGSIIAQHFVTPPVKSSYKINQRFALKREFETHDQELGALTYPVGAAVTIVCHADNDEYYITFDRDKRERPSSPMSYVVSETLLDQLSKDE